MKRYLANIIVDTAAFIAMLLLAATGSLIKFVLPPGSGHFSTIWGMDRHEWGEIHAWIALVLVCLIVLHLYLHWAWVTTAIFGRGTSRAGIKTTAAVAGLLVLVILALSPFFSKVEQTGEPPHRLRNHEVEGSKATLPVPGGDTHSHTANNKLSTEDETHDETIRGSMTLLEVEKATGVSAAIIISELKLPSDTPKEERLGRLKRQFGFEINDVRKIVERHRGGK